MHALTNSGAVLLAVLLLFLLIFFAELSYIFCRPSPSPASKEVLLQFFTCCKKNQSRVEPTGTVSIRMEEDNGVAAATEEEEDVAAVDKWRVSRLLFTIEEDDLEMEDDDDDDGELVRVDIPVECSREPTPFLTPCDSPPYFTPSPSPCRNVHDDVIDVCL
ncbi:uncharacterized protein LOC106377558 [Brassica napus]|uniref:Uncharacterized protein n=1 Tax=Brassica oleracea TaxID=3712 RepID=A0A3P6F5F9_BRAOL|nr:uncharacterized protein LOC106377558 [Brassica napus]VDD52913.1 unnamed protein product [Brassica oleracea]